MSTRAGAGWPPQSGEGGSDSAAPPSTSIRRLPMREYKADASARTAPGLRSSIDSLDETPTPPSAVPAPRLDQLRLQSVVDDCGLDVSRIVAMDVLPAHLGHLRELHLADGRDLHLAVAPPPTVPQLRRERSALDTEAMVLALLRASGLPVAQVLRHDTTRRLLGAPFLLTTSLPGSQLSKVLVSRTAPAGPRRTAIEQQLKRLLASINSHKALLFGPVPTVAMGKGYETWGGAYRAMLGDVIQDAEDAFVHLPYTQIWAAVDRGQAALDEVEEAQLVVPGVSKPSNVLVEPANDGYWRICGLFGFHEAFWGDPEMGTIVEGRPPGPPSESSRLQPEMLAQGSQRQRILLYSLFRWVVAVTTACYRPHSPGPPELKARKELMSCLERLESMSVRSGHGSC